MKDFGKPVRDRLNNVGCSFLRRGKGDHDIWTTPEGKRIVVPVRERHSEGSGPFQGFLSRGIPQTAAVSLRLFGAAHIFVRASEPVVKRDKLSAERVG